MNNLKIAALHGLKVAAHWLAAAVIVGIVSLLSGPGVADKFAQAGLEFGVPTALTNILFAMTLKFLQTQEAQVTNSNAPTTPTPPAV